MIQGGLDLARRRITRVLQLDSDCNLGEAIKLENIAKDELNDAFQRLQQIIAEVNIAADKSSE